MKNLENLEKEITKNDFIQKDKILKEKILKVLDSLYIDALSLIDMNKNIYSLNNNLSLSNSSIENTLKEYIKYNEFLSNKDKEVDSMNETILKKYKEITGISIYKTEDLNLKINFDFLGEKDEYYIILSHHNSIYKVLDINPKEINYKKYMDELNKSQDISLFLCKLVNYELIPYYQNNVNK